MAHFITDPKGKWHPAKEKIGLTNKSDKDMVYKGEVIPPGGPFVYDGPDREAVRMIKENGGVDAETLGDDFTTSPDFIQVTRNMGFNSVEEYLQFHGYDYDKMLKDFEEKASSVKSHEEPKPLEETLIMGGGQDRSGNRDNDLIGGFGDERARSSKELKKTKK